MEQIGDRTAAALETQNQRLAEVESALSELSEEGQKSQALLAQTQAGVNQLQTVVTEVQGDVKQLQLVATEVQADVRRMDGRLDRSFGANYEAKVGRNIRSILGQQAGIRNSKVMWGLNIRTDQEFEKQVASGPHSIGHPKRHPGQGVRWSRSDHHGRRQRRGPGRRQAGDTQKTDRRTGSGSGRSQQDGRATEETGDPKGSGDGTPPGIGAGKDDRTMPHTILRTTAISVGLFWLTVIVLVIIQSALNAPIAGIKLEAVRLTLVMTFPFTGGLSAAVIGVAFLIARRRGRMKQDSDIPA